MSFAFSINGGIERPLTGAKFTTLARLGQMEQARGMIGRMRYVMGSSMVMKSTQDMPPPLAVTNIVPPAIVTNGAASGNAPLGPASFGDTFTVTSNGIWSNNPTSFGYFWFTTNGPVFGEQGSPTYITDSRDPVSQIWCSVTAYNAATPSGNTVESNYITYTA